MTIVTLGDGGVVTLPQDILDHLGVDGEATLEVRFLPGRILSLRLPRGMDPEASLNEPVLGDEQASLNDHESGSTG